VIWLVFQEEEAWELIRMSELHIVS